MPLELVIEVEYSIFGYGPAEVLPKYRDSSVVGRVPVVGALEAFGVRSRKPFSVRAACTVLIPLFLE